MKILGGAYKGRNFYMPKAIRPTQNLLRKAVFDILGQELKGLDFLDLFAGSGAMGLEAISRGAGSVLIVENDPRHAEIIEGNLKLLGVGYPHPFYSVIHGDAFATTKELGREGRKFHLVFADPPYGLKLAKKTLKTIMAYDIVHPRSFVVIQHQKYDPLPDAEGIFTVFSQRKYGHSFLTILQRVPEPSNNPNT